MQKNSLIRRTANLAAANAVVRCLGFLQRIWVARLLGPEGLGLYQMLMPTLSSLTTLVVSGLPVAASRLMAARRGANRPADGIFRAAMRLAVYLSTTLCVLACLAAIPFTAMAYNQSGLSIAVFIFAPALIFQAVGAIESAWCYAHGDTQTPALALLVEQVSRLVFIAILVYLWLPQTPTLRVALVVACLSLAEALALGFEQYRVRRRHPRTRMPAKNETAPLVKNALPPTAGRFAASLLQALLCTLVPRILMYKGTDSGVALAALGTLTGIVTPMLMLPMIISSAMGTVLIPELARLQAQKRSTEIRRLCKKSMLISISTATAAGLMLFALAQPACALFGRTDAVGLLRMCVPLLLPMVIHHNLNALLQGLGSQTPALRAVLVGDSLQIVTALALTGVLALPMGGMLVGIAVGEVVSGVLQWRILRQLLRT